MVIMELCTIGHFYVVWVHRFVSCQSSKLMIGCGLLKFVWILNLSLLKIVWFFGLKITKSIQNSSLEAYLFRQLANCHSSSLNEVICVLRFSSCSVFGRVAIVWWL